jgi:hypothetical protein
LKSDLEKFNNILEIANHQAVKEAIRVEINILLRKIESVKALNPNQQKNENGSCKVIKGMKRPVSVKSQSTLVSSNHFLPLSSINNFNDGESEDLYCIIKKVKNVIRLQ